MSPFRLPKRSKAVVRGPSVDPLSADQEAHYEAGFHSLQYLPDDVVLSVAFNIEGYLMDRGGKRAGLEWTPSTIIVHGRVSDGDSVPMRSQSSTDSSPAKRPSSSPAKRPRQAALSSDVLLGKTPVKKAKGSVAAPKKGSPIRASKLSGPEAMQQHGQDLRAGLDSLGVRLNDAERASRSELSYLSPLFSANGRNDIYEMLCSQLYVSECRIRLIQSGFLASSHDQRVYPTLE
ncbi:hypothetical protein L202_07852 [Cryptococcus amylolentus CBS 6039]|uniref:Uncharacterized protein n=1 Tax=Cryptococcus amylolentus CBS 6039 TaxID=1295533 RepID=A0A1E3HAY0_9TREE|nr:hypothetical protein L202_07852 [Cryptococcus amylolentus CBS 6039]ODN73305.1 hypothetical protein L202_07852 [Cryptococcus amylolentus CBS 6039]